MFTSHKGQSLDGDNLDLSLLDQRVEAWKKELGLINQPEFPPSNVTMSEGSIRFHDRSHILVQDYLEQSSYDLRKQFGETSLPPVFEELLTFFFSKVIHHPDLDPKVKTTEEVIREDIYLMRHLGYITNESILIQDISRVSVELGALYRAIVDKNDFHLFKETLFASTRDCKDWETLVVHG